MSVLDLPSVLLPLTLSSGHTTKNEVTLNGLVAGLVWLKIGFCIGLKGSLKLKTRMNGQQSGLSQVSSLPDFEVITQE